MINKKWIIVFSQISFINCVFHGFDENIFSGGGPPQAPINNQIQTTTVAPQADNGGFQQSFFQGNFQQHANEQNDHSGDQSGFGFLKGILDRALHSSHGTASGGAAGFTGGAAGAEGGGVAGGFFGGGASQHAEHENCPFHLFGMKFPFMNFGSDFKFFKPPSFFSEQHPFFMPFTQHMEFGGAFHPILSRLKSFFLDPISRFGAMSGGMMASFPRLPFLPPFPPPPPFGEQSGGSNGFNTMFSGIFSPPHPIGPMFGSGNANFGSGGFGWSSNGFDGGSSGGGLFGGRNSFGVSSYGSGPVNPPSMTIHPVAPPSPQLPGPSAGGPFDDARPPSAPGRR